jgi:hypothetical protein
VVSFRFADTRPQRNLTHKNALNLTQEKVLHLIDATAGLSSVRSTQRPGDKIIQVGSQRIHTFVSTAPFCLRIRSTNRLRPCYEFCSAWFLIALSMPEKIIA